MYTSWDIMYENKTPCPSPFFGDNVEAKCCEDVLGNRWVIIRHPKKTAYNDKTASMSSEHRIVQFTVWLMKAARWISEGNQIKKSNKKKNSKKNKNKKEQNAQP
jgi:hypothetical protein